MIASVHIADVGAGAGLKLLRKVPSAPGLRHADIALSTPLRAGRLPTLQPGRIALYGWWDDDSALDRFNDEHPVAQVMANGWRTRMELVRAFGTWPGMPDDVPRSRNDAHDGPAVVLTLGRLRIHRLIPFLRTSHPAEKEALQSPGFIWGTAVARPPFVSTCSLWESGQAAIDYAYGAHDRPHPHAIAADRKKPFHHIEAFVRFRPYDTHGKLDGRNPLPERALASA